MDQFDTSRKVDIGARLGRALSLCLLALFVTVFMGTFTGYILFTGLTLLVQMDTSEVVALVGVVLILGSATFVIGRAGVSHLRAVLDPDSAIVSLSPEGFHDRRVVSQVVPWTHVNSVEKWSYRRNYVSLVLDEDGARIALGSGLSRLIKKISQLTRRSQILCDPWPLAIHFDHLLQLTQAYAREHRDPNRTT